MAFSYLSSLESLKFPGGSSTQKYDVTMAIHFLN